jgi:hypothetical protein
MFGQLAESLPPEEIVETLNVALDDVNRVLRAEA